MQLLLVATAVLLAQGAGGAPAPDPVASLRHKIALITGQAPGGRPDRVEVSQDELNAFLNQGGVRLPEGVSHVEVTLEKERLTARGWVDLEQLRLPDSAQGFTGSLGLMGSRFPVEIAGTLQSDSGFARFEVERANVGALPVPLETLSGLVASATRSQQRPQGLDLQSPFRLPYEVQRVRLRPGQVFLEF